MSTLDAIEAASAIIRLWNKKCGPISFALINKTRTDRPNAGNEKKINSHFLKKELKRSKP
jgi:hypothetical protein